MHWLDVLRDGLRLGWVGPSAAAVPFGVSGVAASQWTGECESSGADHWTLSASTASGLSARWDVRLFSDTRAAECWGEVRNKGDATLHGVGESLTLDFDLPLREEFGQPWVRTVNGVRFVPNYFPPHDFAVLDRQLLHTPQVYTPLALSGLEDGRSSGENIPCAILCDERQQHGFALFLEWSGLWRIAFRQEPRDFGVSRATSALQVQVGLRAPGLDVRPGSDVLPLPRVLVVAFDGDLEEGGNAVRRHIRRHVTPRLGGAETLPPTSFNHWFAFGNDFSAAMLRPAVEAAAAAGLEYFCVDGGWFRGGFRAGIGNWDEGDPEKFPDGIAPFADFVRSHGMRYGTWFEPEWAHPDSDLYRQHPDWFLHSPDPRNCHLMNFGLPEVRRWWVERIARAYEQWGVRWIRWDFNQGPRPNWDHNAPPGHAGWRQIEHITGLYRTLDDILAACPELFIEQCAGGGHRIDLGTVRRGHSFWMNDHTTHTDIVRALQHGLNTILPGNYPNTNLCQKRHDFTDYDFLSHACGGFGYSGRLWEAPSDDFARFAQAVRRFKEFRHLLLGDYHRPTGQPARAADYSEVVFSDAGRTLRMEFNVGGRRHATATQS